MQLKACCITLQLLEKRRRRPVVDLAEDLECLCQIMKTCGKVLDKPKAKVMHTCLFLLKFVSWFSFKHH